MKRILGNGRPIAAAIMAVGVVAVAVPALGKSGSVSTSGSGGASRHAVPLPPPPPLSGAARKKLDKSVQCMRSHSADIPGARSSAHGFFIGPDVPRSALAKVAKQCGAPPPPPRGAPLPPPRGGMLPPPMAAPGERGKFNAAVGRCLQAKSPKR